MIGHFILRLGIWFLLTASFSAANIIIGIGVALLLPRSPAAPERLKGLLGALGKILAAVPRAYKEAAELIIRPHTGEETFVEPAKTPRSPGLVFLDIFLITFTPKTIVMNYREADGYEIHRIYRRKRP